MRRSIWILALLAACDGGGFRTPLGTSATGASGTGASGLVGTWRRTIFFLGEDGSANSSETTWRFNADRSAWRSTVTRNHTAGVSDALLVNATWEPLPQAVRITFLPPSSGTFEFAYRITADTLYLASQAYGRIAP